MSIARYISHIAHHPQDGCDGGWLAGGSSQGAASQWMFTMSDQPCISVRGERSM